MSDNIAVLYLRVVFCQKENGQCTGIRVTTLHYIPFPFLHYQSHHLMLRKLRCYDECSKIQQITHNSVRFILGVNYALILYSPTGVRRR